MTLTAFGDEYGFFYLGYDQDGLKDTLRRGEILYK
jgi:hypothetical protein